MEYTCWFSKDKEGPQIGAYSTVHAESPEEAAEKFVSANEESYQYVNLTWKGRFSTKQTIIETVSWIKRREEEERKAFQQWLLDCSQSTELLKKTSFLKLTPDEKIKFYNIVTLISSQIEERSLKNEEIEFLNAWHELKDRELGESLLSKHEMSKPKSEQGKSAFGNWGKVLAMQGMVSQNTLSEIADDMGDISD